jgi:hypothetical protein
MYSKDLMALSFHMNTVSFFSNALIGFILSTKFGTNLRMKFIFPKKDCRDFLLAGGRTSLIDWSLSGSVEIPPSEAMCLKSFPLSIPKTDFLGFKEIPYFLHLSKKILRCDMWSFLSFDMTMRSSW